MVDFAPMNSDISSTAITAAGSDRPATMNCALLRLRSTTASMLVSTT